MFFPDILYVCEQYSMKYTCNYRIKTCILLVKLFIILHFTLNIDWKEWSSKDYKVGETSSKKIKLSSGVSVKGWRDTYKKLFRLVIFGLLL